MSTNTELVEDLRRAAEIVDGAGLADDLRSSAFERVLDVLWGAEGSATAAKREGAPVPSSSDGGLLERIATRLDIDLTTLQKVFEEYDGQLILTARREMLASPKSKAASMRDVALVTAAGRQASGLEEKTAFDVLRRECTELNVLDATNFATEIKRLPVVVEGTKNKKELRVLRHGMDEAAKLIREMTKRADT